MKKVIMVLTALVALFCVDATTIFADTNPYYFDLLTNARTDLTKRTQKAGGSLYESKYYVTPTYFSANQNYKVEPYRIVAEKDHRLVGGKVTIYWSNVDIGKSYAYSGSCPANYYYYLKAYYVDGPAKSIHVEGRYTP